jgi:hypothetical protein
MNDECEGGLSSLDMMVEGQVIGSTEHVHLSSLATNVTDRELVASDRVTVNQILKKDISCPWAKLGPVILESCYP